MMNKLDRINNILEKMKQTLLFKNHDYGDSFAKSYAKWGLIAQVVRISDKYERLCSLMNKERMVTDESIDDTLYDMMGYIILTLAEREGYDNPMMTTEDKNERT
ncbi:MAG: DUF1599 domain-containing protein [Clostridia bacterium]|nr:DUF1599 domain-containing protein [Clostridia bacterium]